jgi:hypothetical protein
MRKITLSVLSFALGGLSVSLVENQTSTFAQESTNRPVIFRVQEAIPIVPPFKADRVSLDEGSSFENLTLPIDGVLCRNCILKNTTLEYAGGEYRLENARVSLPVSIKLVGAANNTAAFLNTFGLLGCPAKPAPPVVPNPPLLKAKYAPSGTIKSQNAN